MRANEDDEIFGFSVKVTFAVFLAIITIILIFLHVLVPKIGGELTFAVVVITAAGIIYGGYYAALSVRNAKKQTKKRDSFQVLQNIHSPHLTRIRRFIEFELKDNDKMTREELHKKVLDERALLTAVNAILGLWEDISIGIQFGCLDEDILFYSLSWIIPWHFQILRPYIEEERERDDPYMYIEMEKLAEAWRNHRSLITGKKYAL